jgi:hypothetical protein
MPPKPPPPPERRSIKDDVGAMMRASYLPLDQAARDMARKGYSLDRGLSSDDTMVFVDHDGFPTVAHRGSATWRDWLYDDAAIGIGRGNHTGRVLKSQFITAKAEAKYGHVANAVGHSLGGRLAENSGAGGQIFTLNKAAGLGDVFGKPHSSDRQTDFRTALDPVSMLSVTQRGRQVETIPVQRKRVSTRTSAMMALEPWPIRLAAGIAAAHSAKNLQPE